MSAAETKIEMLKRHVREGASHVLGQQALISRLNTLGLPTAEAEALLATFKELQFEHEAHLARVEAEEGSSRQNS